MAISLGTENSTTATDPGATLTLALTPSGTGSVLLVTAFADAGSISANNLKFMGTSLTNITRQNIGGAAMVELWYLVDPANSLGTLVGTFTSGGDRALQASVYNGVDPTVYDVTNTGTGGGSIINSNITTVSDNSWAVHTHVQQAINQAITPPAGWTERLDSEALVNVNIYEADNGPVTPAGSINFSGTNTDFSGGGNFRWIVIALIPTIVAGTPTISNWKTLLGAGQG